jgi:hypothetical protein
MFQMVSASSATHYAPLLIRTTTVSPAMEDITYQADCVSLPIPYAPLLIPTTTV